MLFFISRVALDTADNESRSLIENVVIAQQHLLIEATITDRVNGLVNRGNEWDEVYKGAKRCLRCPLL